MKRPRDERGFAMLLVFLMAALIALSLYTEIPRVSFESQRAKEQLLIERGEQYQRAIKVFFRANKKYPQTIQELESFNNHRSLRKQYVDPMTGKKEWRLVHIGPGGVFTDSLVNKPKTGADKDKDKKNDSTTTTQNFIDPNNPNGQPQGPSAVPPRRQSEMAGLAGAGVPGQPGYGMPPQIDPATGRPITQPAYPGMPGTVPGAPGTAYPTGVPGYPGQPYPGQPVPGQTYPGQTVPGQPYTTQPYPGQPSTGQAYTPYPGQPTPAYPGQPGTVPGQPGQPNVTGYPYSTVPGAQITGAPPFQQPGTTPVTGSGPAAPGDAQKMIQDLLTRPTTRTPAGTSTNAPAGQTIGGGLAGVASTADAEGIKVYNEKTNYKEWEFLYDFTKDRGPTSAASGPNGTPVSDMGTQPGQTPAGQTPAGQTPATQTPFGGSSLFGQPQGSFPGTGSPPFQPPRQ